MSELLAKDLDRPVRDFISPVESHLQIGWTVAQALDELRQRNITSQLTYFYVVDEAGRLLGVLPTRKLLLSQPQTPLAELLAGKTVMLPQDMTLGEAMEEFAIHRLLALPVVDHEGKLLGLVDVQLYAEEAVDLAESNRLSDLYQLIGLSAQQLRRGRVMTSFRARMPWLIGNIISGLACAAIAAVFHLVLGKVLLLAMFIPLVLTLSEAVAMQSMTLTLQYLHGAVAPMRRLRMRLLLEWQTVLLLGTCAAGVGALAAMFWPGGGQACLVILLSIFVSMIVSATLGTIIPFSLHLRKLDPHVAAGPMVLMLSDVIATAFYLGLATLLLL
jgi:magnesium transporter